MTLSKSPWATVYISVLASFSALVSWWVMSDEAMIHLVRENGSVENLTLIVYIVAVALILYSGRSVLTARTRIAVAIVLVYMFMREADLHKSVGGTSILKIKFWLGSQFPVTDKLIAFLILAPVAWALFYFIKNHVRPWWSDLCRKEGYAIGILVFLAVLAVSKIFDRSLNVMTEMWGWHFPLWAQALVTGQEEYLECILPLLVIVSFYQYREMHGMVWRNSASPFISVYLVLLTSFSALVCCWVLPTAEMLEFVKENGTVEVLTLVAYVIAILVAIAGVSRITRTTKCAVVIMLAYMFMREADLHKSVGGTSILKIKFWLGSQFPVTDKLLAVLILFPLVWMLVYFVAKCTRTFLRGLRNREGYAVSIFVFLAVLFVSKCIDRSLNVLTELYQMHFPDWVIALQVSQEEFLECLLPILIIMAFFQYRREAKGDVFYSRTGTGNSNMSRENVLF